MKISKSILKPSLSWSRSSRSRSQPMSLPSCLSRRLHTNGSIKNGQLASSMMFTTATVGKKRGSAVENPEPSSPKVTCIGQVRVRTRKKKRRYMADGDQVSFRKTEKQANYNGDHFSKVGGVSRYRQQMQQQQQQQQECVGQRWVHLPHTICEALRAELSCLFPCRREKEEADKARKTSNGERSYSSCARWLVMLQDGGGGKRREVELVVGEDAERREVMGMARRRHVLEDFEVKDEISEARVSICIPPKNALLLMRCRSDPVKVAALTNRFCMEAPVDDHEDEDNEEAREELKRNIEEQEISDAKDEDSTKKMELQDGKEQAVEANLCSSETPIGISLHKKQIQDENRACLDKENVEDSEEGVQNTHQKEEVENKNGELNVGRKDECKMEPNDEEKKDGNSSSSGLPDCLLLMMFEPKLSMEVSKETWVCTRDFIRWLPQRQQRQKQLKSLSSSSAAGGKKDNNHSDEPNKRVSIDSKSDDNNNNNNNDKSELVAQQEPPPPPPPALPPRSSCSLPAASVSMAAMIEHKLVNGVGYEPFVLTRCKSEPMRTAAKLAPDSRFLTKKKLEPLRRAASHAGARLESGFKPSS